MSIRPLHLSLAANFSTRPHHRHRHDQLHAVSEKLNGQTSLVADKLQSVERKLWNVGTPFETAIFHYRQKQEKKGEKKKATLEEQQEQEQEQ